MNIGAILPRHARYRPDDPAVVFEGERLSFGEFNKRVNRLANGLLGAGIAKGDKVATVLHNCLDLYALYWAVAKTGAVVVPLSPLLNASGLVSLIAGSDAVMVLSEDAFADSLDGVRDRLPDIGGDRWVMVGGARPGWRALEAVVATASEDEPPEAAIAGGDMYNIIFSSGTTGEPKGIVHTHDVRSAYCIILSAAYRMTPESVVLHAGSIIFNGAFLTMMPAMHVGAKFVLQRRFDVEDYIAAVEREGVTHVALVPSQIVALLDSPNFNEQRLGSLEMLCNVGAPILKVHKERVAELLPGRFHDLYGQAEGFIGILDKYDYPAKPDSVGVPVPFYEMRVTDDDGNHVAAGEVGEICGRGPFVMAGYYKRPDLTNEVLKDGWLHTGDLGYVDGDGYLYVVDRKKDMLISGGVNVYPKDIEEIVVQHPAVRDAAVFGVPDDRWGEVPIAAVVLNAADAVDSEELAEWINGRVQAKFQRVREVAVLADFPRNAAGKTMKRLIREEYQAPSPAPGRGK